MDEMLMPGPINSGQVVQPMRTWGFMKDNHVDGDVGAGRKKGLDRQ